MLCFFKTICIKRGCLSCVSQVADPRKLHEKDVFPAVRTAHVSVTSGVALGSQGHACATCDRRGACQPRGASCEEGSVV